MPSQSAKIVAIGALELRFLVDETDGKGDLVMFEFSVPPEAKVPAPHYHVAVDEAVYGLAGKLTSIVDGVEHDIGPGEWLFIPRGAVHYHRNQHGETAKALIVLTPGSIGRRYFEEMADALAGPGRPDPERMKSIMVRHGLVPA
jgi:quercetin dioxygenase-like cupin family protein